MNNKCKCGNEIIGNYGGRCEDCYAEGQRFLMNCPPSVPLKEVRYLPTLQRHSPKNGGSWSVRGRKVLKGY